MNQKLKLLLGIIALVVLLSGAYVLYNALSQEMTSENMQSQPESEKQAAPDFTVYDLDGNPVKRSDYLGKPLVINFWATWCPYCVDELPEFHEVYVDMKDEVVFLMVDVADGKRETIEKASAFLLENGYQFPVVYDTDLNAVNQFGVTGFPTTVFIDRDGNLLAAQEGKISKELLLRGIELIKE
jgi:thiol-disulfide isomerase/thioredoxin